MHIFWVGHFDFFFSKFFSFFAFFIWKLVKVYWLARMAQNFDQAKRDNTFWPTPNILGGSVCTIVVQVVDFSSRGTKLERFLPKTQHTQGKSLNFENWCNREVSKSALIWYSKSIFSAKNHWNLSQCFWITSVFKSLYFMIRMPNFRHLPITPILKIQ